jgi:mannose-1-phosphate guanylyltransferase
MPSNFHPVILAGGRGTRFWPLSRKKRAKQLLALDGKGTMIQQTVTRLLKLSSAKQVWVVTNEDLRPEILRQLRKLRPEQVIAEPVGRNTAPAIGLAAFILQRDDPNAVIGAQHLGRYRRQRPSEPGCDFAQKIPAGIHLN